MLIYCDSSALVKLVLDEAESEDLDSWLAGRQDPVLVSSTIARTEVLRAVARSDPEAVDDAMGLLDGVTKVDVDSDLADQAGRHQPAPMRSLDALHLAAALQFGPALGAFVAYDKRLAEAARAAGLAVNQPGT